MSISNVFGLTVLLALSLLFPRAPWQRITDQQEFTVRVKTELVQLRAVVTDRRGQPVDNLSKADFLLLEDGKPQDISLFSLERIMTEASPQPTPDPAVPSGRTRSAAYPIRRAIPSRSIVLLVDTIHCSFSSLSNVRAALRHFVNEQMTEQDVVALVTPTGTLGVMEQFTQDRRLLAMGIEKLFPWRVTQENSLLTPFLAARIARGDPDATDLAIKILAAEDGVSLSDHQGLFFDPRDRPASSMMVPLPPHLQTRTNLILTEASCYRRVLLTTIRAAASKLAEMPGQRIIALLSDGFTMVAASGELTSGELAPVLSQAARSGVVIYCFDSRGLVPVMIPASVAGNIASNRLITYLGLANSDAQDSLKIVARETGGEAFYDTNDLAGRLRKMLSDNRVYYDLAYYPPDGKDPKTLRRISISVRDHPEYVVRAQRGYILSELRGLDAGTQGQAPQNELRQAMSRPLPLTDIGVSALAEFYAPEIDQTQIELRLQIRGEDLHYHAQGQKLNADMELAGVIYDLSGKPIRALNDGVQLKLSPGEVEAARVRGYRFSRRVALQPGFYHIRVGVRDIQTSRIGTAIAWVEVPNLRRGKLILSDIELAGPVPPNEEAIGISQKGRNAAPEEVDGLRQFKQGQILTYSCVVYNPPPQSAPDELQMQLDIFQGEQRLYQQQWFSPYSLKVDRSKTGLRISGQVDLSFAQSGIYELHASLRTTKSNQKAQRAVAFVIAP